MKKNVNFKKLLFFLLFIYAGYIFVNQQIIIGNIKKQVIQRQTELENLQEKNQKLQDEVKMSKSDSYIEKLAREKLNLIKEGEIPVISNK
ncbi:septum formation initiator family protein [Clostridium sp. BSD9I1]|uniref:FtsB family cell division protein n=1 Tax=Clostridium sp. BSD9I1 TaxID=2003589 RepID=UPI0016483177|nr:septum formation initiator family protein [Clostridium sp. BSD9I1]MBE6067721.1 septum formation initiator family protein [Clostridium lundense]